MRLLDMFLIELNYASLSCEIQRTCPISSHKSLESIEIMFRKIDGYNKS